MYKKVGDIKKILADVPDDYEIRYQRIHDVYFTDYGWDSKNVSKKLLNCLCYHSKSDTHDEYCYSEYVEIFSCIIDNENKVVKLNAHY